MTCPQTPKCEKPCGLCPEQWPVPAGSEYGDKDPLRGIVGAYIHGMLWDCAMPPEVARWLTAHPPKKVHQADTVLANQSPAEGDALPPLPKVGPIGFASVVDVEAYALWLKIGPHLPGVRDVALWTTDQMRAYARAAQANVQPKGKATGKVAATYGDKWEGAEEWMPLAWELCANENGEEACTELIWEGGPIPEPWGDRWLKYEDQAKEMIAMVRKHVQAPAPGADGSLGGGLTYEQAEALADKYAGMSQENHGYLDQRLCDKRWKPHKWVVEAVMAASRQTKAKQTTRLAEQPGSPDFDGAEALEIHNAATDEPMVRFCPGCGSVGDVDYSKHRDCCPDGAMARVIPAALADRCRDLFQLAIQAPSVKESDDA